jgi:hypothetical protein
MKKYFVVLNRPAAGLKICGGGWTLEAALTDAENNCGKKELSALRVNEDAVDGAYSVSVVSEKLGKDIEEEGSTSELAARVYAEAR